MRLAFDSDVANNQKGLPAIAKLRIIPEVLRKLKHFEFSIIFLENGGLELINAFLSPLPDGSWPLSTARSKIYSTIYKMPVQLNHIRSCAIGKTLGTLLTSKMEFGSNKKLIQAVKDKWSRLICNITTDYVNLEQCETNFLQMPLYTKHLEEPEGEGTLGKRKGPTEEELNMRLSYTNVRQSRMGYNFSVRPNSGIGRGQMMGRKYESQEDLDKHLMRIRRLKKSI